MVAPRDTANHAMYQVFTPIRTESFTTGGDPWAPTVGTDRMFMVAADCDMTIDSEDASPVLQGMVFGIVSGSTYNFSVSQVLLVA